jgi:hypothetical protein
VLTSESRPPTFDWCYWQLADTIFTEVTWRCCAIAPARDVEPAAPPAAPEVAPAPAEPAPEDDPDEAANVPVTSTL